MFPYPHHRVRRILPLDGSWEFAWLGHDVSLEPEAIASPAPFRSVLDAARPPGRAVVPGCFDTTPDLAGRRGTAVYRTRVPAGPGAGRLAFDGLGIWAAIYVDGSLLHVQRKPYSPFVVDVPPAAISTKAASGAAASGGIVPGARELIVVVDNRFDTGRSPLQENYFDFYAYGGIFRGVQYHEVPDLFLREATVTVRDLARGLIAATVTTSGPGRVRLRYAIDDALPGDAQFIDVPGEGVTLELAVPDATTWSPEAPHLHTIAFELAAPDAGAGPFAATDDLVVRFGLRTVEVRGREILLNGSPVRLFGWNRHEAHPQFGPALPAAQLAADIAVMKAAGSNFVRGSHYPQDGRFLDLCDELGMMVWEESIGWQQDERHFANPDYVSLVTEQQREMIRAHANHPSIVMWGFQNELHSEKESARPLVEALARATREEDGSRPLTFATCRFPNDRCLDLVDIVSINTYPGWYAADENEYRPLDEIVERVRSVVATLDEQGQGGKPLILSEIGAGAVYGWRDAHAGHWSEQYQADYLSMICREFLANPRLAGLALWQYCDCRTYGSALALRRPRAFNNKGILDEYRRPKLAYDVVRGIMTAADRSALQEPGHTVE